MGDVNFARVIGNIVSEQKLFIEKRKLHASNTLRMLLLDPAKGMPHDIAENGYYI